MMAASRSIVDLACGAGSIFEDFVNSENTEIKLIAADISQAALDIVKLRVPIAQTICCSCDDLPFEDASLDLVVSQFGIEYAGYGAFDEAARVLSPQGELNFLMHFKDGYIDRRNKSLLVGAKEAISSRFVEMAIELIEASFNSSPSRLRKAEQNFQVAERLISNCLNEHPNGIHEHLYFGFREMYSKYQNYHKSDILDWLSAMRKDIKKTILKVQAIRDVSLGQNDIEEITRRLEDRKMSKIRVSKFTLPHAKDDSNASVLAWHLTARK